MESIKLNIYNFQDNTYFSPIRKSNDYIRILLNTCRNLLINNKFSNTISPKIGEIEIVSTKKHKRVFYFKNDKFYSLYFPFKIIEDDENETYEIYLEDILINNKIISEIFAIIDDPLYTDENSVLEFYLYYSPESEEHVINDISLICLEKLINLEPSYIRYDYDEENADEEVHPLNHFDINYTECSKIKIGLNNKITLEYFKDFLDKEKKCIRLNQ